MTYCIADARELFNCEPCRMVKIDAALNPNERYLVLQVDDAGEPRFDRSFWLHPTVHVGPPGREKDHLLTNEQPVHVEIANNQKNDRFGVNTVPNGVCPPLDVEEKSRCGEFLYAHAPSSVRYAVPRDAIGFSAIGYCLHSQHVQFALRVDNQESPLYEGKAAGLDKIQVALPPAATELTLIVRDLGDQYEDQAFWLYPRFHLRSRRE